MSVAIMNIDQNATIVSNAGDRDGSQSSSADLFAQITYNGSIITTSSVKDYEQWAVIHGLTMNLWRKETGDVSNSATNSSAFLGMDEIQFALPCSDVDLTAIKSTVQGQTVDITFIKTGNIGGHSKAIESFAFTKAQIVSNYFYVQTAVTPSITIRFKPKNMTVTRYSYVNDALAGQNVFAVDFVTNTSK